MNDYRQYTISGEDTVAIGCSGSNPNKRRQFLRYINNIYQKQIIEIGELIITAIVRQIQLIQTQIVAVLSQHLPFKLENDAVSEEITVLKNTLGE